MSFIRRNVSSSVQMPFIHSLIGISTYLHTYTYIIRYYLTNLHLPILWNVWNLSYSLHLRVSQHIELILDLEKLCIFPRVDGLYHVPINKEQVTIHLFVRHTFICLYLRYSKIIDIILIVQVLLISGLCNLLTNSVVWR